MKINLGCGENYIPGFVHIDKSSYPHVDYQSDVKDLSFIPTNSVELIYASHLLEYFDRHEVINVLEEWYRVLKPGGILRLAVPDFESIVKVYLKYKDLDHRGILGPLYGKWHINDSSHSKNIVYHKTTYDFFSIKKLLDYIGFKNIRKYRWEDTIHADYDDYSQAYIPHLDKKHGILISLNIEAQK